ncbi:MAG: hypothetical protein U5K43_09015 [Halofilum sp. (in: g-proteobacteria)]|nr:hypothetical protein [Halofilum sp. (in: g-proteobacteria)]
MSSIHTEGRVSAGSSPTAPASMVPWTAAAIPACSRRSRTSWASKTFSPV